MKTPSTPQFRFFRSFNSEMIAVNKIFAYNISPSLLHSLKEALRDGYLTLLFTPGRKPRYKLIVTCEPLQDEHKQVFNSLPLLRQIVSEYLD